jgi:hypothetical protein
MNRLPAVVALLLALPLASLAITEPKTETEYPDTVTMTVGDQDVTLEATGVALREKTFMKVDVYTVVSYVAAGTDLGDQPHVTLRTIDAPRRIQMDLRRSFGRDKLVSSFSEVIAKNYDDLTPIADDMATFLGYFDRDAQDGDRIVFSYAPGVGLTTELNGEVKGVIAGQAMAEALWTVWFGDKPADKGMRKALSGSD